MTGTCYTKNHMYNDN